MVDVQNDVVTTAPVFTDEERERINREASRITLKGVKVNNSLSDETLCFSASIYLDGKRVGTVGNRGHGGPNEYDLPRDLEEKLDTIASDWLKANAEAIRPEWLKEGEDLSFLWAHEALGSFIDHQVNEIENERWLKRQTRKKTLFRLKGDKKGSWRTIASRGESVVAFIKKKHGDKVERIV